MGRPLMISVGRIQPSIVRLRTFKLVEAGTMTLAPFVLNSKACPTLPVVKESPLTLPLLPLTTSAPSPFAGHQPTSPVAGGTQLGDVTVSVAFELVAEP